MTGNRGRILKRCYRWEDCPNPHKVVGDSNFCITGSSMEKKKVPLANGGGFATGGVIPTPSAGIHDGGGKFDLEPEMVDLKWRKRVEESWYTHERGHSTFDISLPPYRLTAE